MIYGLEDYTIDDNLIRRNPAKNTLKTVFSMAGGGNQYRYVDLTNVSDYKIQAGDVLEYEVFWEGANLSIGVDLFTTDGWTIRDGGMRDQNGYSPHPNSSSHNSLCQNKWYKRQIPLTVLPVGKTFNTFCIACEYDSTATITAYFANIVIKRNESIVKTIWTSGAVTTNPALNSGSNSHTFTPDVLKNP